MVLPTNIGKVEGHVSKRMLLLKAFCFLSLPRSKMTLNQDLKEFFPHNYAVHQIIRLLIFSDKNAKYEKDSFGKMKLTQKI